MGPLSQATQLVRAGGCVWNQTRCLWTRFLCLYPLNGNVISRLSVSWLNKLEITGCASPGFPPQPLAAACRFWPQRPYLYSAQTSPYQAPLHRARLRDSWASIQAPARGEGAPGAHAGRREWLPGKSPVLKSEEALGAEEQLRPRRARS